MSGNINEAAKLGWSSSSVSGIYEKTRPDYDTDSVEFLLEKVGALNKHLGGTQEQEPFTIVELGAGTGKFTRAVLRVFEKRSVENVNIISTEPIKEMCDKFKHMVPTVEIVQRPAHNLGLPSNSADVVLAAQSFHWFANAESVQEIHRVLKPKGMLGIIWCLPDRSVSWIKTLEEMLDVKYKANKVSRPEFGGVFQHIENHVGFGPENGDVSYRHSMEFDLGGIIERFKSVSVIAGAESHEKEAMLSKVMEEMTTNPDIKHQERYSFSFVVQINWFQKN